VTVGVGGPVGRQYGDGGLSREDVGEGELNNEFASSASPEAKEIPKPNRI
jgi:hypothetical protein